MIAVALSCALAACGDDGSALRDLQARIARIEASPGELTPIECPLPVAGETEGEDYVCGVYTVPIDYQDPAAGSISLTYVQMRAANADTPPSAVVYLAGGPGQSGVVSAGGQLYGDLRDERDLIFPAQRGTLFGRRLALEECVSLLAEQVGRSELNAFVDEVSDRDALDRSLPYDEYLARYRANAGAINGRCHAAFRQAGLDPGQFNTANSARDLVGLMDALGYETYDLHGTSYGTRLALELMRRHPEAPVRSVVLDSPAVPSVDRMATLAVSAHEALARLYGECAADASCHEAYPDLMDRTVALLARLEAKPLSTDEGALGAAEVIDELRDLGGTRSGYLPRMIAELEAGETETYVALVHGDVGTAPAEGALVSSHVTALIQDISLAGMRGANPVSGLRAAKRVLDGVTEDEPRAAMKANAEEALADADRLPGILERIDGLTDADIQSLREQMSGAEPELDGRAIDLLQDATAKNNAQFMLSGIVCLEQLPFADVERALAARDALDIPALGASDALLATEIGNCANYPMPEIDPAYGDPVASSIPTLILQGEFDTRTPPQNGRALADQLDRATLVVVPRAGHETWGHGNCAAEIGIAFLRHPDRDVDLSCLDDRRQRFVFPNDPLEASAP